MNELAILRQSRIFLARWAFSVMCQIAPIPRILPFSKQPSLNLDDCSQRLPENDRALTRNLNEFGTSIGGAPLPQPDSFSLRIFNM
jgi:hypothetical protein